MMRYFFASLLLMLLILPAVDAVSYSAVASHLPSDSQYSQLGPDMTVDTGGSGGAYSADGRYFKWSGETPRKSYTISQEVQAIERTYDEYGNVTAVYLANFNVMISEFSDTSYMDDKIDREIADAERKGCARITDGYACSDPSGTGITERYSLLRNRGDVVVKISARSRPGTNMGYTVAGYIAKHRSLSYSISNIIFSNYGLTENVIVDPNHNTQIDTQSFTPSNTKTGSQTGSQKTQSGADSQTGTQTKQPDNTLQNLQKINQMIKDNIDDLKAQDKGSNKPITVGPNSIKLQNGQEIKGAKLQKAQQTKAKIQAASDDEIMTVGSPDGGKAKVLKKQVTASKDKEPGKFYKVKKFFGDKTDYLYDQIADQDPTNLMKVFKNYFSSAKDDAIYTDAEKIQNEADRLGVDKTEAKYYSKFSSVPDTEKKFSKIKNVIPVPKAAKPFEYVINHMGVSVEKEIAHSYKKEYELTKQVAQKYAGMDMTWSQIIQNTKKDIGEQTVGEKTVTNNGGTIPTGYLDTMSKDSGGAYNAKTQDGRISIYINELRDAGLLDRPQDEVGG